MEFDDNFRAAETTGRQRTHTNPQIQQQDNNNKKLARILKFDNDLAI